MKQILIIKNQKGASAVEFAIIAPLLLVLLFGIVEFGFLLYNKAMITNAAREGARAGIIYNSTSNRLPLSVAPCIADCPSCISTPSCLSIECVVCRYASEHLVNFDPTQILLTTIVQTDNNGNGTATDAGDSLKVTVQYNYDFLVFPDLTKLFGGSFANVQNLKTEIVMRYE